MNALRGPLLALACAGCAARVGVGGAIDGAGDRPPDYLRTFEAWTQEAALHDGFTTVLLAKATLVGPPLARAMAAERAFWAPGTPTPPASDAVWTVAIAAASDLPDLGFPTDPKPGAWSVGLVVDGARCTLAALEPQAIDALTRRAYPNLSPWDRQWLARFGGCPAAGTVQLQLTGAHGALELGWQVDGSEVRALKRAPIR